MKIKTTKLSVLHVERSIKSTSTFQQLQDSNSNLNWSAEMDSWISSLGKVKQKFYSAWRWMDDGSWLNCPGSCSNFQLPLVMLALTVQDSARKWRLLACRRSNSTCRWWINEEIAKDFEEFCRKCESKKLWDFAIFDLDLVWWCVNPFSVRISLYIWGTNHFLNPN